MLMLLDQIKPTLPNWTVSSHEDDIVMTVSRTITWLNLCATDNTTLISHNNINLHKHLSFVLICSAEYIYCISTFVHSWSVFSQSAFQLCSKWWWVNLPSLTSSQWYSLLVSCQAAICYIYECSSLCCFVVG